MVRRWLKKTIGSGASTPPSEKSGEYSRRRLDEGSSSTSDPAFVGLCRVMIGVSVLLLIGLMVLVWFSLNSGIDWDASVVQLDHGDEIQDEARDSSDHPGSAYTTSRVVRFDLEPLNGEGLLGPEDGLKALSYEFCIPAGEAHVREVEAIDSTIEIQRSAPGRIGCGEAESLAIGHTHQPDFRQVLVRLSRLPYVDRIEQAHFE